MPSVPGRNAQFQAFHEEFKDQVTLLGIDLGPFTGLGLHEDADELLQELGVTYPAGWTYDGSVPRKYGVTSMPTTVFIDSSDNIFDKRAGAIDRNALVALYHAIAGGRGGGCILKPNTATPNYTSGFTRVTLVLFQDTVH